MVFLRIKWQNFGKLIQLLLWNIHINNVICSQFVSPFQYSYWCRQYHHAKARCCTATRQYEHLSPTVNRPTTQGNREVYSSCITALNAAVFRHAAVCFRHPALYKKNILKISFILFDRSCFFVHATRSATHFVKLWAIGPFKYVSLSRSTFHWSQINTVLNK